MTYTDCGRRVPWDSIPQAFANGVEWAVQREGHKDRLNNLYRFRRAPVSWALWHMGSLFGFFHKPGWALTDNTDNLREINT